MRRSKARPSLASLAKQIEQLTPKTRRAERGFEYEFGKLKSLCRSELSIASAEARRHARSLRVVLVEAVRKVTRSTGRRLRAH